MEVIAEVGVAELALDNGERDALARHLAARAHGEADAAKTPPDARNDSATATRLYADPPTSDQICCRTFPATPRSLPALSQSSVVRLVTHSRASWKDENSGASTPSPVAAARGTPTIRSVRAWASRTP